MFEIRGVRDLWSESPPILDGLKREGGIRNAYVDEATGKYVVDYDPRRIHRDQIARRVVEIGEELGRSFEPIFDDR